MADHTTVTERPGFVKLLWGMVTKPARTLALLNEDGGRAWLWMALLALVLAVAPVWAAGAVQNRQAAMSVVPSGDMSGQVIESGASSPMPVESSGVPMSSGASSSGGLSTVLSIGGRALGVVFSWLLWAVALYIVTTVSGGRNSFKQMLHMVTWTWLPYAVRGLVQTLYILISGQAIEYAGLSGFAPGARAAADVFASTPGLGQVILQRLLGQVDLYWVWNLVLLVLGVTTVAYLSRRKSVVVTVAVWLLITGLGLVPVLVTSSLAGTSTGM